MTLVEYQLLGDLYLMTLVSFFLLALPGYALVRRQWPESDWNLSGSVSTSKIQIIDLLILGGFIILFTLQWKFTGTRISTQPLDPPSALAILNGSLGYLMFAAIVPAVIFWRANLIEFFGLRWDSWRQLLWIIPSFIIGIIALGGLLYLLGWNSWVTSHYSAKPQQMVELIQSTEHGATIAAIAIAAIIIAPIAEEIIFRGYLYPVVKRFSERWFATLFNGLLFGIIHFNLMGLPLLILMGVILVILYEVTGSLWAPIACHAAFNALQIILMLISRSQETPLSQLSP